LPTHGFLKFISDKSFEPQSTRHLRLRARFAMQIEVRSPRKSENFAGFALLAVPFGNLKTVTTILRKPSLLTLIEQSNI
jgi:hypothetical protein